MDQTGTHRLPPEQIKKLLARKWPEAVAKTTDSAGAIVRTGLEAFDRLFPQHGLPYGQLIEITGGESCGKTSLLFKILAAFTQSGPVAYVDFGGCLFPAAAASSGVDIERLVVVTPENIPTGLRLAEQILGERLARAVVLDLVGQTGELSQTLLHRLRQQTNRSGATILFLTENNRGLLSASTVSLRLEVKHRGGRDFTVTVTKSRLSREGVRAEVHLDE